MGHRIGLRPETGTAIAEVRASEGEIPDLAQPTVGLLLENHRITTALADEYDFTTLFLLQPTIWTEDKPLHAAEVAILGTNMQDSYISHTLSLRAEMANNLHQRLHEVDNLRRVYDLSDIFDTVTDFLYFDWVHVNEIGNRIVAERIFEILKEELWSRPPKRISELTKAQLETACA